LKVGKNNDVMFLLSNSTQFHSKTCSLQLSGPLMRLYQNVYLRSLKIEYD